jgi:hypothetical protein
MSDDPIRLPFKPPARPRGGQRGNNNALKHGFYASSPPPSETNASRPAAGQPVSGQPVPGQPAAFTGLQDEIAALRILNRRAIERALS